MMIKLTDRRGIVDYKYFIRLDRTTYTYTYVFEKLDASNDNIATIYMNNSIIYEAGLVGRKWNFVMYSDSDATETYMHLSTLS